MERPRDHVKRTSAETRYTLDFIGKREARDYQAAPENKGFHNRRVLDLVRSARQVVRRAAALPLGLGVTARQSSERAVPLTVVSLQLSAVCSKSLLLLRVRLRLDSPWRTTPPYT